MLATASASASYRDGAWCKRHQRPSAAREGADPRHEWIGVSISRSTRGVIAPTGGHTASQFTKWSCFRKSNHIGCKAFITTYSPIF